jgi:hypothetical protein
LSTYQQDMRFGIEFGKQTKRSKKPIKNRLRQPQPQTRAIGRTLAGSLVEARFPKLAKTR